MMINFQQLLSSTKTINLFDHGYLSKNKQFEPFMLTDIFMHYAGMNQQMIIHFWQLERTMILGMKDTQIPYLQRGLTYLEQENYTILVRNSGGLGVIADNGILNISLILPNPKEAKYPIDTAYKLMWEWITLAFQDFNVPIDAYEISDSYCPGTFDLSINGKKFAGIAQRRVKEGLAVMIYLSINGDQLERGKAVQHFYETGLGDSSNCQKEEYPKINPNVMANLEDLLNTSFSVDQVKERLLSVIKKETKTAIDTNHLIEEMNSPWFTKQMQEQFQKMLKRNESLL